MFVMGFDGRLGQGKTLGMSVLAQHVRQQSNGTLFSNYGLKHSRLFTSFNQFLEVAQQPSSLICLDEAHTDLDARSGNTNSAKYLTHMLFYLRKIRATIFFSTPNIRNVDFRIVSIMNSYCHVRKNKTNFYYDMFDPETLQLQKSLKVNQKKVFAISHQIYDTHKMVVPMIFPEAKEGYLKIITDLKELSDDYYIRQATDAPEPKVQEAGAV